MLQNTIMPWAASLLLLAFVLLSSSMSGVDAVTTPPTIFGRLTQCRVLPANCELTAANQAIMTCSDEAAQTGCVMNGNGLAITAFDLELEAGALTGRIPAVLAIMTQLTSISLGSTDLTGVVPPALGDLTNLITLSLGDVTMTANFATPTSPDNVWLAKLVNLETLDMFGWRVGEVTGPFPSSIESLTKLTELRLSNNKLTGTLPAFLGGMTTLKNLYLEGNNFYGVVPTEWSALRLTNYRLFAQTSMDGPKQRYVCSDVAPVPGCTGVLEACVYEWSEWSTCSASCAPGGQRTRYPVVSTPSANFGQECPSAQTQACNTMSCPVDCVTTSELSACTGLCPDSFRNDTKTIIVYPAGAGVQCPTTLITTETCPCDGDCVFLYGPPSLCSGGDCGTSVRTRTLNITSPAAADAAVQCPTEAVLVESCDTCRQDSCDYTFIDNWTSCSQTCKDGAVRSRVSVGFTTTSNDTICSDVTQSERCNIDIDCEGADEESSATSVRWTGGSHVGMLSLLSVLAAAVVGWVTFV
jgi:hypothetical protein